MPATRRELIEWRLKALSLDKARGVLTAAEIHQFRAYSVLYEQTGNLSDDRFHGLERLYQWAGSRPSPYGR